MKYWFEIKRKVRNFYMYYKYRITNFYPKLKRGLSYFIQGWETLDSDYSFLLEDILFKIKRFEKELYFHQTKPKNELTLDEKESLITYQSIRACRKLLEKVLYGEYNYFTKQCKEYSSDEVSKERYEAYNRGQMQKKNDFSLFMKIFEKYYEYWWD